jgi:DNA helicase II / ATP-dependent DNA helicase PcrA
MLHRAEGLLGHQGLGLVRGGTFHGFAYSLLKHYAGLLGFERGATVMDRSDGEDILGQAKDLLKIGKGDRKFPKRATVLGLYSKSRNKELTLDQVLRQEAYHLGTYEDDLPVCSRNTSASSTSAGCWITTTCSSCWSAC